MVWQQNSPAIVMLCRTHERDAYGCLQCKCARYWPKVSFGMLAIMIYYIVDYLYYKTCLNYKITQYLFSHSLHQKLTQCGYVIWRFDFLENIHWNHLVWEIPQKKFLRLQLESTTVTTIWWNPYTLDPYDFKSYRLFYSKALSISESSQIDNAHDTIIRKIEIHQVSTSEKRVITQYHYRKWPDFGVPEGREVNSFLKLVKLVSQENPSTEG